MLNIIAVKKTNVNLRRKKDKLLWIRLKNLMRRNAINHYIQRIIVCQRQFTFCIKQYIHNGRSYNEEGQNNLQN